MSSNVGFNLTMQRRGLPIAYMLSLGNKLKFDLHDAIRVFAMQDRVTALGLYVEALPDPKAFQEAVDVARELGKPIVAIKTGRSDLAKKMVVSHTASLAGSDELVTDLFERLGVARVNSLEALINLEGAACSGSLIRRPHMCYEHFRGRSHPFSRCPGTGPEHAASFR